MPSRDRRDHWVVAGDDQAGWPPDQYRGGYGQTGGYDAGNGYAAGNGSGRAAAPPGGQYSAGARYNGAYDGGWEPAEQSWPAGTEYAEPTWPAGGAYTQPAGQARGGYADPGYQPRHVGRYPVRSAPPPTSAYPPGSRPTEPVLARRGVTASATARVPAAAPEEESADPGRTRLSAVLWTLGFYLVPVVVYLIWAATLSGDPPAGCVGPDGGPCPPPRTAAFTNLTESALALAGALFASLVISLGLARLAGEWRGFTVGFAASVIGAGAVTLFVSAIG